MSDPRRWCLDLSRIWFFRLSRRASRVCRGAGAAMMLVAIPALSPGQGPQISGAAQLRVVPATPSAVIVGSTVQVSLTIDLTSVTGRDPMMSIVPAVLGGYQVAIPFDKNLLRFESVTGGTSLGYTPVPAFTSPAVANANGSVSLVASQTSSTAPTGLVHAAVLTFSALAPGTVTLTPNPLSLSSALLPGSPPVGPTSIPGVGVASSLTIVPSSGGMERPAPLVRAPRNGSPRAVSPRV